MIKKPGSLWGDVIQVNTSKFAVCYDAGNLVEVEFYNFSEALLSRTYFEFPERLLFVRGAISDIGEVVVCGQGNDSGTFYCSKDLTRGVKLQAHTYGTHTSDVIWDGTKFRLVVQVSAYKYYDTLDHDYHDIPVPGTSQGIIQLLNSGPQWSDLLRASVPEMLYPFQLPGIVFGEGAVDPAHIQCLDGATQKNIHQGVAERPRGIIESDFHLVIASRNSGGVFFEIINRPFPNYSTPIPPDPIPPIPEPEPEPEPEPMACTPVVPTQDVVRDSMDVLRNFCQTYVVPDSGNQPEWRGKKPYVNDEIHNNGLYISDGLLYFMMSDTGRWAQVLMNPDDKRPWNEKRKSADDALQKYMKERVGDFT